MRKRLKQERLRLGLTCEEIAACLGVEVEEVVAWESGEREPMASQLRGLSRLFGCSLDWLVSGKGEAERAWLLNGVGSQRLSIKSLRISANWTDGWCE